MKKILHFISENLLLIATLVLIVAIPLYPKLPLFAVPHTWVYIRLDDFLVSFSLILWIVQFMRRKATLASPLTIPIILFWIAGLISTVFSIFFYFPHLPNVFPTVALFFAARHIEYMALFFVAFSAMRKKSSINVVVSVMVVTMLLVVGYGFGQRFYPSSFPAFSTMNEEFAKGIPLVLSPLGRIQSTFAGHYDLAAYLVMLIPLIGSMVFGYKRWWIKIVLILTSLSGVMLLLMTASRTSYAVYLVSIVFMLVIQKKKRYILPVIIISYLLLSSFQGLYQRYTSTISSVDLVVDARTGKAVGIAKKDSTTLTVEDIQSTGENLPQGSSYINLPQQQVEKTSGKVVFKKLQTANGKSTTKVTSLEGDFVVKKALAYDVSFTTRLQGEWPRAIEAFKRNMLLGSGYSSISLATDGNYLRILGEVGLLGFITFFMIFLVSGIYLYRILPTIDSPVARSFLLGSASAMVGLMLNAVLIDVFEGSKVAYTLWLVMGVSIGLLHLYQQKKIDFRHEITSVLLSPIAIIVGIIIASFTVFSVILSNFFVADDFTWLRWIAECHLLGYTKEGVPVCEAAKTTITHFFTQSGDFFYRPGTKLFFYVVYSLAGMNPTAYHLFSILMHIISTTAVFLISLRLVQKKISATIVAILFLVLSSHFEAIVWISSIGHLATSMFCLLGLLFYIYWRDNKSILFFFASLVAVFCAPLFHESGIVAPLFLVLYALVYRRYTKKEFLRYMTLIPFLLQIPLYLLLRQSAGAIWGTGDYAYNLVKLPYNILGNGFGYLLVSLMGSPAQTLFTALRNYFRLHLALSAVVSLLVIFPVVALGVTNRHRLSLKKISVLIFSVFFFLIALAPFIGLGNLSARYTYLPSFGVVLAIVWAVEILYLRCKATLKPILALGICVIVIVFCGYHIAQINQMNKDWSKAGKISQDLITNFSYAYGVEEHLVDPVFFFVGTPLSIGHAYVFPTGLKDVLWFPFQNDHLTIHEDLKVDMALDAAEGSSSARVFRFDSDGAVEQVLRITPTPPVLKNGK